MDDYQLTLNDNFYDRFQESQDIRYAALAIGNSPDSPPEWALEACYQLLAEYTLSSDRFDDPKRRGPSRKYPLRDGMLLDAIADLVCDGATQMAQTFAGSSEPG